MLLLPLSSLHNRAEFDCNDTDLNRWLQQMARQHRARGIASTFVAVEQLDSPQILGYYALNFAELVSKNLPASLAKRLPEKVPVFRVARLAVSAAYQQKRIGEYLLMDAVARATRIKAETGGVGVLVNAKPNALNFYKKYGFEAMQDHSLNLFLSI